MKLRSSAFAAILTVVFAISAAAQAAKQTPAPATSAQAATPVKLAIIDTEAFGNPKVGIKRLVNAFAQLETEFRDRRTEITTMQTRLATLVKEIQDGQKNPATNRQALTDKADQAQALESEIKRKQEDGQRAFERRNKQLMEPINIDIGKAVQAYAKQRGFDLVLDAAKFLGTIMVINQGIDITGAFIADYNSRNPAGAATTVRP
jgi:Skp family chaperone for outer membrane proteins